MCRYYLYVCDETTDRGGDLFYASTEEDGLSLEEVQRTVAEVLSEEQSGGVTLAVVIEEVDDTPRDTVPDNRVTLAWAVPDHEGYSCEQYVILPEDWRDGLSPDFYHLYALVERYRCQCGAMREQVGVPFTMYVAACVPPDADLSDLAQHRDTRSEHWTPPPQNCKHCDYIYMDDEE